MALARLLTASEHVLAQDESAEDLRLLLAPGSSLGGARPKASVFDVHGRLAMAKFPSSTDEWPVVLWEALALKLAGEAGIQVPAWQVESVAGKSVLLLQRFDRMERQCIPFLSAMSMLGARDHETHSYLEMVDVLRRWGATPAADMRALFRRMVFHVLISNTDDHLRNHGFLFTSPAGWQMAPAYDLNPTPVDVRPRVLATQIDGNDGTASLELALQVAEYFELTPDAARQIAREVAQAVAPWRTHAARLGLSSREVDRMSSAFEHADLARALK